MGTHDRAWEGLRGVVVAKQPMLAMRLEQALVASAPAVEVQFSSFESYDEAYKFCKQQKNVGFLFIHESCGESSFLSVFRELAAQYSNGGLPAFGVVLHDGNPSAFSERAIGKSSHILDYLPVNDILESQKTSETLRSVWTQFSNAFESLVIPKALQSSLIAVAEDEMGADGAHFIQRLSNNLLSELNVSWIENIAARWAPVLRVVHSRSPSILKPHPQLLYFLELCKVAAAENHSVLMSHLQGKLPVYQKAVLLTCYLESHRKAGTLEEQLRSISSESKPGAPKLVRHIAKHLDRIVEFQSDAQLVRMAGS